MRFEVRALTSDSAVKTIEIEAADAAAARLAAQERSLRPIAVRARAQPSFRRTSFSLGLFSQELLALLDAGLSLIEALESLQERAAGEPRDVIGGLAAGLRQGQRLSQALAAQPSHFPALYVGIIHAAETTSDLPAALARFVEFEQRSAQMRSKALNAAIYPLVLLLVGGGVTLFLVGFVVPRFASVYEESGRSMSFLTAVLLHWGRLVSTHGLWLGLLAIALIATFVGVWRVFRHTVSATSLLLCVPGLAKQVRSFELSRLYMTLGLLLSGGIALVKALHMVESTVSRQTGQQLQSASRRIASGERFSAAMSAENLTTAVALRLFRVGERAGTLAEMLQRTARFHDNELSQFIDRFSRSAEPIMMTAIGLIVGTIVVLLYMPIFELAGSLQ